MYKRLTVSVIDNRKLFYVTLGTLLHGVLFTLIADNNLSCMSHSWPPSLYLVAS